MNKYFTVKRAKEFANPEYKSRLEQEIKIFTELGLMGFIKRITEIYYKYISKYPVLLRGSAGSSLLLYYLGINKIDPIKYSIPISRFINLERKTLPDIDFDLPYSVRNQLIDKIIKENPDTIRMTSCAGMDSSNIYFPQLLKEDPTLNIPHSSGIIVYSPTQSEVIETHRVLPNQIGLTKDNFHQYGLKKIDILSNTALEQLYNMSKLQISQYDFDDKKVWDFIANDDGFGITFAETPSIQNVIHQLRPTNIEQLSICMALIRPFASHLIIPNLNWEYLEKQIIYDDDFILFLMDKLGYSADKADGIRRLFKNNNEPEKILKFKMELEQVELDLETRKKLNYTLVNLSKYGFCKSHSINYAQMIYCLYWNKFYKPKLFWEGVIKSVKGYYRDWVYIRKALGYGLKFKGIENCSPFYHLIYTGYWLKKDFVSRCYFRILNTQNELQPQKNLIFEQIIEIKKNDETTNNNKPTNNDEQEEQEQEEPEKQELEEQEQANDNEQTNSLEKKTIYKYTTMCEFRGIIAGIGSISTKYKRYQMVITLGYDNDKFIQLHLNKRRDLSRFKQIIGKGFLVETPNPHIVVTKMTLM